MHPVLAAALALLIGACSDSITQPSPDPSTPAVSGPTLSWNQTARELIVARAVGTPTAQIRMLTYLSVAQYNA
ncbi:MAG: hypothetical protein ACREMQ_21010, partial [Longimicrobiales bacterium]